MDPCFSKPTITDDLLNFSNVDLTTTSSSTDSHLRQPLVPPPQNPFHHPSSADISFYNFHPLPSADLSVVDDLCIPNDDVAELEWFSQFMDNCFHDDVSTMVGSSVQQSNWSFTCKADHSKRSTSRAAGGKSRVKTEPNDGSSWSSAAGEGSGGRRCTHCATEKTPQWRSGPLGPKTLCNACGVRYKSGRLVPEYRPASSPTFVLSQHSNSHRKVLELRRQKELELVKLKAPPLE